MQELAQWDSFYSIVGSAAGSLIGLQFVVMTLIAQNPPRSAAPDAGATFGTPTIYHFSAALLLSALLRAPWRAMLIPAALWGLVGFCGVVYVIIIIVRMCRPRAYRPFLEDWVFHAALPLVAYAMLAAAPFAVVLHEREALFGVAAAVLLLLFVGIHNAWDNVAYHVYVNVLKRNSGARNQDKSS